MNRLSRYIWALATVCLIFTTLGCATQQRPEESRRQGNMPGTQVGYRDQQGNRDYAQRDTNQDRAGQNMRVADNVADSLTKVKGVDSATVMVTDDTAYVGVMMRNGDGDMTDDVKDQIARQVRKEDPSIKRVYVSANPNFAQQINNYAKDIREGRPVSGLINNFMDLIQRTFPNRK